jgi:hypothetical protein
MVNQLWGVIIGGLLGLGGATLTPWLAAQLERTLEELESSATEDELAAEMAATKTTMWHRSRASGRHANRSRSICGFDRGGERAAVMFSLIVTAKMNDVDPTPRAVRSERGHIRPASRGGSSASDRPG